MPEQEAVNALIDRILAGARIPTRAEREDLRRELWSHFDEAGLSPDAVPFAIRRFGPEAIIADSLCRVYRWERCAVYAARLAASMVASLAAALLILALVNLRVGLQTEVWRLAPGFSRALGLSLAVVLALVAAREIVRAPFSVARAILAIGAYAAICGVMQWLVPHSVTTFVTATVLVGLGYLCSKLPSRPLRWLLVFTVFAAAEYGIHLMVSVALPPGRVMLAGAVLVAVWASTMLILTRIDYAFVRWLDTAAN
jgi:hypothetical protein